jgi:hypothetical protein
MQLLFGTLIVVGFLGAPVLLMWGWIRFAQQPKLGTLSSILSLIGLILATTSAVLAVSSIAYAVVTHGFRYYDPRLLRIFRWGILLSLGAILLGTGGIGRPSSARWQVPVSGLCMLAFWIIAAEGE